MTLKLCLAAVAVLALGPALSGCDTSVRPPADTGICYHFVMPKGQKAKFNVLSRNVPNLETCAAALEGMRIRFLTLGGNQDEIVGAYQSKFIFLRHEGIFTSDSLEGGQYLALVRSGDGRLVVPGAMPQQ